MEKKEIRIRSSSREDAEKLLEIYAPYVRQTAITFENDVPTVEEFAARMEQVLAKYPYLVAEQEGELLGYTYAGPFKTRAAYDWAVETSIYVRQDRKRMGIGSRLYNALEEALKAQGVLNLNACIAYAVTEDAYLTNDSVRYHERCGYKLAAHFHQCGYKFNRWYDMVWMEKLIGKHTPNPRKVRPYGGIGQI